MCYDSDKSSPRPGNGVKSSSSAVLYYNFFSFSISSYSRFTPERSIVEYVFTSNNDYQSVNKCQKHPRW